MQVETFVQDIWTKVCAEIEDVFFLRDRQGALTGRLAMFLDENAEETVDVSTEEALLRDLFAERVLKALGGSVMKVDVSAYSAHIGAADRLLALYAPGGTQEHKYDAPLPHELHQETFLARLRSVMVQGSRCENPFFAVADKYVGARK